MAVYVTHSQSAATASEWNFDATKIEVSGSELALVAPYISTAPKAYPQMGLYASKLWNISVSSTESSGYELGFTLLVGEQERYWDGTQWADSDGTYAETSVLSDMLANIETAVMADAYVRPVVYFYAVDDSNTPKLSSISLDYTPAGASNVSTCLISGKVVNGSGVGVSGVTVTAYASGAREASIGNSLVYSFSASSTTQTDGTFTITVIRSGQFSPGQKYSFKVYSENEVYYTKTVTVPDQATANFQDLK